jgi:hypothetical protein
MTWMEFVLSISATLGWPVAVIVVVLVLRREFKKKKGPS